MATHASAYTPLRAWTSAIYDTATVCAVPRCAAGVPAYEEVYAVVESGTPDAPPFVPADHPAQWVCWRHVHPERGPVTVPAAG